MVTQDSGAGSPYDQEEYQRTNKRENELNNNYVLGVPDCRGFNLGGSIWFETVIILYVKAVL
jgi:hypothetical protein